MTEEKLKKANEIQKQIGRLQSTLNYLEGDKSKVGCSIGVIMHSTSTIENISDLVSIKEPVKQLIIEDLTVQIEVLRTQFKEL